MEDWVFFATQIEQVLLAEIGPFFALLLIQTLPDLNFFSLFLPCQVHLYLKYKRLFLKLTILVLSDELRMSHPSAFSIACFLDVFRQLSI